MQHIVCNTFIIVRFWYNKPSREEWLGRWVPVTVVSTDVGIEVVDNLPIDVTSDWVDDCDVGPVLTAVLGISVKT